MNKSFPSFRLPSILQKFDKSGNYKGFRLMLYGVMFIIFFIPLMFVTSLSFYEYGKLLAKEKEEQLIWQTQGAQKTVEAFIHELQSVVTFIAREYSYEELQSQDKVSALFSNLKAQYPGFVDLGIIGPDGIQQNYAGPFRLQGYDYNEQDWYTKVLTRQLVISDVFLGYRNLPHFVIAVSNKLPGKEEYWVLRLSIDSETLQKYIMTISTKASQDIFLVNQTGVLQTKSNIFGNTLEKCPLFSQHKKGEIATYEQEYNGVKYMQACVDLENSPWILGIVKQDYIYGGKWASFRYRQYFILAGCTLLAAITIIQVVNTITIRLRDADERRNAAITEVEHSNKLASIGRLAAGVAHEINNPLAVINQKAGLIMDLLELTDDFKHKAKMATSLDGIQDSVERCKVITHRLLGFARRMDVVFEQIDINDLLHEVLGFLEKEALYNHIHFVLSLDDTLPLILSDRGQLQQIFLNITNNAIDAIGKDGEIELITTMRDENNIQICIKDTGPGIPPEITKRIFDPFFTTKEAGKGTGLGLSITYGLAKKLGGNISVSSGETGTIFTVVLPINNANKEGNFHG